VKETERLLGPGWAILLFLLTAVIPNTFTSTLLAPGLPALATQLGDGAVGVTRAQLLMTIPGVAMLLSPVVGAFADRIGPRRIMLACLACDTAAGLGSLLTDDFATLLVLRFMLGIGVGGLMAISLSMIGDYYDGEARTRMLAYRWAAMCVYTIVAVQLAGYLATHFGWSAPLWLYAVGVPLFFFALFCVRPDGERRARETAARAEAVQPLREVFSGTFLLAMAGNVFLAIAVYNAYAQLPFLLKAKGYSSIGYANVMLPMSLTSIFVSLTLVRLRRVLHPVAIIALALVLFAVGTSALALAQNAGHLVVAAMFVGAATVLFEPALSGFLLEKIHPSRRAMAMGGIFGTFHLGPFLIPFIFGGINSRYGFATSFHVLAAAALIGAVLLVIGLRGHVRSVAVATQRVAAA